MKTNFGEYQYVKNVNKKFFLRGLVNDSKEMIINTIFDYEYCKLEKGKSDNSNTQ